MCLYKRESPAVGTRKGRILDPLTAIIRGTVLPMSSFQTTQTLNPEKFYKHYPVAKQEETCF